MSNDTRHDQLITAGWRYDATQDRYTPPGEVQAGTERWYNQNAAWLFLQSTDAPTTSHKRTAPVRDPRRQEPQ